MPARTRAAVSLLIKEALFWFILLKYLVTCLACWLFVEAFEPLAVACGIQLPGWDLTQALQWKHRVSVAGPPGKSIDVYREAC